MVKTRSQTGNITIKKEEVEDCKPALALGSASNTRNKITIRKPSKNKNLPAPDIKVEQDTDTKPFLQPTSKSSELPKGRYISQEQINQLIDYVVNHGMSVTKASRKVKMAHTTGRNYYYLYKNDPEKKIPSPRNQLMHSPTQQRIENLIRYIKNGKMSLPEASAKADMNYQSGHYYYNRYLKDPDHKIPIPLSRQNYTQDQKNEFIGYIVNDKMSIKEASIKANMSATAGRTYYHKYFDDQNTDIAIPSHITIPKRHTQEQIKEVTGYIVNDKMSIRAASRKINMCQHTTRKYYRQYLKDHNMKIPEPRKTKRYTPDKINQVVGYIIDGKMSITAASKKANINFSTGKRYYTKYLNGQKRDTSI